MTLTLEGANEITNRRNAAMMRGDVDAFLDLWDEACVVEGPEHYLEGKEELGTSIKAAFAAMKVVLMTTRSMAVQADVLFYEWTIVWEVRASGERMLFTGMTHHRVSDAGKLLHCREYFDPSGSVRKTVLLDAAVAAASRRAE
ncbi:MAG: hypothetical protein ACI8W3_003830 [Myxococcota bacterium]|jgi:hypothetical protein